VNIQFEKTWAQKQPVKRGRWATGLDIRLNQLWEAFDQGEFLG